VVLLTKRLVAAEIFLVAATKILFVVPNYVAITKPFFFRERAVIAERQTKLWYRPCFPPFFKFYFTSATVKAEHSKTLRHISDRDQLPTAEIPEENCLHVQYSRDQLWSTFN